MLLRQKRLVHTLHTRTIDCGSYAHQLRERTKRVLAGQIVSLKPHIRYYNIYRQLLLFVVQRHSEM